MTDLRTAAQAVIDILEHNDIKINDAVHNALNDLRQALAEHDNRKPIAWEVETKSYGKGYSFSNEFLEAFPRFPLPSEPVDPVALGWYRELCTEPVKYSFSFGAICPNIYDKWKPLYPTPPSEPVGSVASCQVILDSSPPSVDALISMIDGLTVQHFSEKGVDYFCYDMGEVNAILDKYRGVK